MPPAVLRIFVSSPGDVGEERVMTARVVQRLQGLFGQSVKLEPIIWEHEPMRATQHPQEQIPLPSECDIVVCLLWSRLGTRLPDKISAAGKTGTEWEFEDAARSFRDKNTPDLLVYRKTREVLASVDDETTYAEKKSQWNALSGFLTHWFKSEDGTFKAVFKTFEALDQFEDLLEKDLRRLIQERLKLTPLAAKTWHHAPFRGLEVFDYEHAPIFFGRTRAIGGIREALVQQAAHGCAFVLVFGMSGVGKSSLVRAGVLPTITQPGVIEGVGLWRWCVFRPSDAAGDLCDGLATVLMAPPALPELAAAGVDGRALAKLLREAPDQAALPLSVGLKRAAETTAAAERLLQPPVTRLALVVDQLEELFSAERVNEPQRAGFVKALAALARSGHVWIIGTMRSDFYPRCADLPELAALKAGAGQFDLLPPTAPQLAQMIGDPARAAGLRFEEKATGERLDHVLQETALRDPQALPLLEFTLAELYKLCSTDKPPGEAVVLTFAAYDQLGGMEGALARRAEEEYAKLPGNVQAALPAVFRALVTVRQGEDEAIVAQPVFSEVFTASPEQNTLVEAFIRARLFVSDRTGAEQKALVRLAHEALLRCWPRLVQWLTANREFLRIRARVSEEAARWRSEGQLPELLLAPGKPLAEGEFLLKQQRQELDAAIVEYIESSRRSAARARRWRRVAVTAFVLSLVIGTVASSYFGWQSNNARKRADESAEAEKKARQKADESAEENRTLALKEKNARRKADESAEAERNARQKADDATKSAMAARKAAEDEKSEKEKQLDRAELLAYVGKLSQAQQAFQDSKGVLALQYLDECQWNLRGWEHRYLWTRINSKQTFLGHTDIVTSVAISADGKRIVSGSKDKTVKVWDAITGQEVLTLKGHTHEVSNVALSADGKLIVSGGGELGSGEFKGFVPDLAGGLFGGGKELGSGELKVWDADTGKVVHTLTGHTGPVSSVAVSADGKRIVSGGWVGVYGDQEWKVWDAVKGQEIRTLKGHTEMNDSVAISADGKRIVTVGNEVDEPVAVKVWDADTGKVIHTLTGHKGVARVAISADGKRIVSGGDRSDGTVKLWDAVKGELVLTLGEHFWGVYGVAISADGKRIVSGGYDRTVKVWEAGTGQEIRTLWGHTDPVTSVAISADGKFIVSGSSDRTVKVWDGDKGHQVLPLKGHTQSVNSVAISADGKRIISGSQDMTVKVRDGDTGQEIRTLRGHTNSVTSVAVSADGRRIVSGSGDKTVKVWDANTGQEIRTLTGHTGFVISVAISADGKRIISGDGLLGTPDPPGEIKVWDAETGQEIRTLTGHKAPVVSVAFSPDGKRIVSGSMDRTVKVWDADTGQDIFTLKGHTDHVTSVAFSPDGKRIVSGSDDKTLKVWDADKGQEVIPLKGHAGVVYSVAFSPDGKRIASGSQDMTVKVWDADKGQEVITLKENLALRPVKTVAFSRDGKRLVSGRKDGTVMVWDAGTGQVVRTLEGNWSENVSTLGFSADGKRIVAKYEKGGVRFWDAIKGQEVTPCTDPPPPKDQREAVSPDGKLRIWAERDNVHAVRSD